MANDFPRLIATATIITAVTAVLPWITTGSDIVAWMATRLDFQASPSSPPATDYNHHKSFGNRTSWIISPSPQPYYIKTAPNEARNIRRCSRKDLRRSQSQSFGALNTRLRPPYRKCVPPPRWQQHSICVRKDARYDLNVFAVSSDVTSIYDVPVFGYDIGGSGNGSGFSDLWTTSLYSAGVNKPVAQPVQGAWRRGPRL
jgi:hypothetical protein